ncbi:MAG: HPr kinase/phosphorylase [Chlamydiia bacterium]|nr:HPr kinase/phosphorylase [Chlamydiia bacterium]
MLSIEQFYEKYSEGLELEFAAGKGGVKRQIKSPHVDRPGLALAGHMKGFTERRILVFGRIELEYLRGLDDGVIKERFRAIIERKPPMIMIARRIRPTKEMVSLCNELGVPMLKSSLNTMELMGQLSSILREEFAPMTSCHGTLVEAFGVGVMIQGDSSVGKSETALGLIERGHRLISDDVVIVRKKKRNVLEGTGPELTRHLLEIRGIGIINVAHLYGAVCISESKQLNIVVKLEEWDDAHFYDRIGLEEKYLELLGVKVPHYIMPVKPGRDVVLLLETIVLNHRLKKMGYNSAKEFNVKLLETISNRQKQKKLSPIF